MNGKKEQSASVGFVWSTLTKGNPAYTVVQVATNDLIILVAFVPIVKFLLGVSKVAVPWDTLILSVVLFVVIPLAGGFATRYWISKNKGIEYFEKNFCLNLIRQPLSDYCLCSYCCFPSRVCLAWIHPRYSPQRLVY